MPDTPARTPKLLALLGSGTLSDRVDRRLILLGADVSRFGAILVVAVLVMSSTATMWQLAVLSVVYGLGAGTAAPAFDAIIPDLVPQQDLGQANALDQFLRPTMLRLAAAGTGRTPDSRRRRGHRVPVRLRHVPRLNGALKTTLEADAA